MDIVNSDGRKVGIAVLEELNISTDASWYWIGAAALLGFAVLFNVLFTLSLTYLNPIGKPQAVIPEETNRETKGNDEETDDPSKFLVVSKEALFEQLPAGVRTSTEDTIEGGHDTITSTTRENAPKRGMVLPFTPLIMSFYEVEYSIEMPAEMKEEGITESRLQLLRDVTGSFHPGVLTALMGVSGAGKTTLMDVLAGRKTGGFIEGDIRISGYPKKQEIFARISGYCEQNDIHSPQLTVRESLIFSAFLRLPKEVEDYQKKKFVDEVMDLVELDNIQDAIVGLPAISGLSTEQRKRLTIAVELVANPSIIFMDEPTSGLDARAAAIVMRTVRNTVDTGRTVVCTIHQPSTEIFETFDELLLMKIGGQVIYFGPLGQMIPFFEEISGVPKITDNYNPSTWVIEVTSASAEARMGIDFAEYYSLSTLYKRSKERVKELSQPRSDASELYFPSEYSQPLFKQFKLCVWKQWWSYWRKPDYNVLRILFSLLTGLLFGSIFWKMGDKRDNAYNLLTVIGALYAAVMFNGVNNCTAVIPVVSVERTVFYREKASGMYSPIAYAIAQVVVEIPYVMLQTICCLILVYGMMDFTWTATKLMWFFYIFFVSLLMFTYYGMMVLSLSPNPQVAVIMSSTLWALFNMFAGFFIPRPKLPPWWTWYYWACPLSWSTYGLIASQYGDVEDLLINFNQEKQSVREFMESYFGYHPDFIGVVAVVLLAFTVFFACVFAFGVKKLNFQTR